MATPHHWSHSLPIILVDEDNSTKPQSGMQQQSPLGSVGKYEEQAEGEWET